MTDFQSGDRVKITFEATVSFTSLKKIEYIQFDSGLELEFPVSTFEECVTVEKIEKPLEIGWHEGYHQGIRDIGVMWWAGAVWLSSPQYSINDTHSREKFNSTTYLGRGTQDA